MTKSETPISLLALFQRRKHFECKPSSTVLFSLRTFCLFIHYTVHPFSRYLLLVLSSYLSPMTRPLIPPEQYNIPHSLYHCDSSRDVFLSFTHHHRPFLVIVVLSCRKRLTSLPSTNQPHKVLSVPLVTLTS